MILPGARRALELLVQAGGELVLLGPGWHQPATCGEQYVEGPCWVPPDRGPGRRPRVIEPVSCEHARELFLAGLVWPTANGRLLLLPAGRRVHEAGDLAELPQPPGTLEDLECEQCGGWIGVPGGCVCEVAEEEEVDHG